MQKITRRNFFSITTKATTGAFVLSKLPSEFFNRKGAKPNVKIAKKT